MSRQELRDAITAALVKLAEHNVPPDTQEMLLAGNSDVKPGALSSVVKTLINTEGQAGDVGELVAEIDPERWLLATHQTSFHCSQVQGFLYNTPQQAETENPKHHVLRDCTKEPGEQTIWSAFGDDEDYDRLHDEMSRQTALYRTKLIAAKYADLSPPPASNSGEGE